MKIFSNISRILYGLIFVVFGLNGFFQFAPVPPMAPAANDFIQALISTGYMLYFWKSVEVVSGLLFLLNRFVPLGLLLAGPVTANIIFFHLFLDPGQFYISILLAFFQLHLMWLHKSSFLHFFKAKN